jgi:hypothetical protein
MIIIKIRRCNKKIENNSVSKTGGQTKVDMEAAIKTIT